ncbi:MazG-like family protein [Streptomyces sp. Act-28]
MDDTWKTVEALRVRLDGHAPDSPERTTLLRILKLSEEVGEVAEAVIGAYGRNPRKGESHTWDDVRAELCDVIVTAMVALHTLTPDAPAVFAHHLARVHARSTGG